MPKFYARADTREQALIALSDALENADSISKEISKDQKPQGPTSYKAETRRLIEVIEAIK